jgi:hypothetical protein
MIRRSWALKCGAVLACALGAGFLPAPASAAPSDKVRLSGLADVAFGTIDPAADQTSSQNLCAFSNSSTGGYSVTASGSGSGGAFTLASAADELPYEVRWAGTTGQANGTAVTAGTIVSGFTSAASQQTCNSGPAASATLTVIVRATSLGSVQAGSYAGTLQITIAPE